MLVTSRLSGQSSTGHNEPETPRGGQTCAGAARHNGDVNTRGQSW